MCGIFGIALRKPAPLAEIFKTLERLEVQQYPEEPKPIGGYGAGIALLMNDGDVLLEKVGRVQGSPAKALAEIVKSKGIDDPSVLIGHVRMPSPEYMDTAGHKAAAQPYVAQSDPNLTVASAHNGKVENYMEIRKELGTKHVLESDKIGLIDSEVLPHYFVELLEETEDTSQALYSLFCGLKGSSAIGFLHVDDENSMFHLIHKGKTRGLTIWTNDRNEVLFCSRIEPVMEMLHHILAKHGLREKISIRYHEDMGLKISFPLVWR